MIDRKAMKRGMDLVTGLGWMCLFLAAFMILGAGDNFTETGLMLLAFGAFTALPGTLINICIALFSTRRAKPTQS